MITHIIYHIPGRKVGCTSDLKNRLRDYRLREGVIPLVEILEELHDKTDQEAGDIEWAWADRLGYRRRSHYTHMESMGWKGGINRVIRLSPERLLEIGRMAALSVPLEQRKENSRKGGLKGGPRSVEVQGREKLSENGRKGGRKGGRSIASIVTKVQKIEWSRRGGIKTSRMRAVCPHCGLESTIGPLHHWHFDRCPKRPMIRRAPIPGGN